VQTPLTYWISSWMMGGPQTAPFLQRYGDTLLIAMPAVTAYTLLRLRLAASPPTRAEPATPPRRVAFLDRLPSRLGRELLCLEMEDHYVRAHTEAGSDLILMRMRDAVAELDGLPGLQVHRSWWVAEAAVAGHKRNGRQLSVSLKNGLEAPVARSAEPAVKAAGWLDRR
jgi:DNA-binding LytR/AlgR family response regulator